MGGGGQVRIQIPFRTYWNDELQYVDFYENQSTLYISVYTPNNFFFQIRMKTA
jgi:hypothetical protein